MNRPSPARGRFASTASAGGAKLPGDALSARHTDPRACGQVPGAKRPNQDGDESTPAPATGAGTTRGLEGPVRVPPKLRALVTRQKTGGAMEAGRKEVPRKGGDLRKAVAGEWTRERSENHTDQGRPLARPTADDRDSRIRLPDGAGTGHAEAAAVGSEGHVGAIHGTPDQKGLSGRRQHRGRQAAHHLPGHSGRASEIHRALRRKRQELPPSQNRPSAPRQKVRRNKSRSKKVSSTMH